MVTDQAGGAPPHRPPLRYALTPAQQRSRRLRNIAIGVTIGLLVVLFYAMTIAKMGAGFIDRPI